MFPSHDGIIYRTSGILHVEGMELVLWFWKFNVEWGIVCTKEMCNVFFPDGKTYTGVVVSSVHIVVKLL